MFTSKPQLLNLLQNPRGIGPVMNRIQDARFPLSGRTEQLCLQGVTANPMHHNAILAKEPDGTEKLANGDSPPDLVDQIAAVKLSDHCRNISQSDIRVIAKFPAIPGHELSEDLSKVG